MKILAERRAGELLSQVERNQGPGPGRGHTEKRQATLAALLAVANIPVTTAKRWQILAKLPAARLTALVEDVAESLTAQASLVVFDLGRSFRIL